MNPYDIIYFEKELRIALKYAESQLDVYEAFGNCPEKEYFEGMASAYETMLEKFYEITHAAKLEICHGDCSRCEFKCDEPVKISVSD